MTATRSNVNHSVLNYGVFGLFLIASCGIKQVSAAGPTLPATIQGSWASRCTAEVPAHINFAPTSAEVVDRSAASSSGARTCRLINYRSLSQARWYLDLECQDGSLLQLDIYLAARDELLVTRRPLGEACLYKRS